MKPLHLHSSHCYLQSIHYLYSLSLIHYELFDEGPVLVATIRDRDELAYLLTTLLRNRTGLVATLETIHLLLEHSEIIYSAEGSLNRTGPECDELNC